MPRSNWKITFYGGSTDYATTAYTQVAKTTVAAYTGVATTSAYIVAPQKTKYAQSEILTDISGWEEGSLTIRDKFDVELYPFAYGDSSDPDLVDWEALASWLAGKAKVWVAIEAGGRNYPSDTTKAIPVNIEAVNESVNRSAGTHNVTLTLRNKATL